MLKKTILVFFLLLIPCFITALLDRPLGFIICLNLLVYGTIFLFIRYTAWILLPRSAKNQYEKKPILFGAVIFVWLILLYFGRAVINEYYLSHSSFALRMSGKIAFVLFMMGLVWCFLIKKRRSAVNICSITVALFIVMAPLMVIIISDPVSSSPSRPLQNIQSLPYLDWVPADNNIDMVKVTLYDPNLTDQGLNLYTSHIQPDAFLIDMLGNILHTWQLGQSNKQKWPYAQMQPNGDLTAIAADEMIAAFDWNSKLLWKNHIRAHHDFFTAKNGDIYLLTREDHVVFYYGLPVPILVDYIVHLSPQGKIKRKISLFDLMPKRLLRQNITNVVQRIISLPFVFDFIESQLNKKNTFLFESPTVFNVLHANSVALLYKNINGFCKNGDLLFSLRELDFVGVIDMEKEKITWSWGPGNIERQHHPSLLDNGNLLIFDNGSFRKYSRIIELDPVKKEIVWNYQALSPEHFFTRIRGSCQRLPNGNTLVTDTETGRVFEVTLSGKKVWEYYNHLINKKTSERAAIYRMTRIINTESYPKLKPLLDR